MEHDRRYCEIAVVDVSNHRSAIGVIFDVDLAESERTELTAYYRGRQLENGIAINGEFDLKLRLCTMQRLMQALGAYGFLGLVKGHKHFLKHVAAAMHSLQCAVAEIDGLTELDRTLLQLT